VSSRLEAGAAAVRLAPPLPVVRAGYGIPRAVADRERDPLQVRALVVRAGDKSLAVVLADLVLIPDELTGSLETRLSDLGLDGVVLVATHTHSSVGGFDSRLLAQVVGTGRYRSDVVAAILDRAEEAVRKAHQRLMAVKVRTAEAHLAGWAENRSSPGAAVDDTLTVAQLDGEAGEKVATLAIMAAHPTLFPRTAPELSPDYPGAAMKRLESAGGVAFLFQGAEGDARPPGGGVAAIEAAGEFVAQHVAQTTEAATRAEPRLAYADVEVSLPPAEPRAIRPFLIRRPASNLLAWIAPRSARVTLVTLGNLTILGVPGEPTAAAGKLMLDKLSRDTLTAPKVRVVALVGGYIGYIDTPQRVRDREGEGRRAWFEPELVDSLGRGIQAAVESQRRQ
jgi:hypothetical protein